MIRTMLAAPLVIRAIARPVQKRYHPLNWRFWMAVRPQSAMQQPSERRTSISPTRQT